MMSAVRHCGRFPRWRLTLAVGFACFLGGGCENAAIVESEWKVPNPWGAAFADREAVVAQIPIGSSLEKIRPVMQAHGYEEQSRIQHDRSMKIVYVPSELTRLRKSYARLEISFELEHEIVVAVKSRPLPTEVSQSRRPG